MQNSSNPDRQMSEIEANRYTRLSIMRSEELYGEDFQSPGGLDSVRAFAEELEVKPGTKILDIGSGVGGSAFYFAGQLGATVVGVDASPDMVAISTERAAERGIPGVTFRLGRIEDEPLEAETFDIAWTRDSVVCVQAKDRLWENVYHGLKPGGRLFVTDFCRSRESVGEEFGEHASQCEYYLQDLDEYVKTLEAAGFRDVTAEDLTHLFVEFLYRERSKLEDKREDFESKYGADEFQYLHDRWNKKIRFSEQGDLRWGKFTARK